MPPTLGDALATLKRGRGKVLRGLALALMVPAATVIAATIDAPSSSPPDCIARDVRIAQLVRANPELIPLLERQRDPSDSACGPVAVVVRELVNMRQGR
jgi:hypothetical protein